MLDYVVKKVIAKEDERIIIDSSYDEFLRFKEDYHYPEFTDKDVLSVKFVLSYSEEDDEVENTDWYINPHYSKVNGTDDQAVLTMPGDFVPEILLLGLPTMYIIKKYGGFNTLLLRSDEQLTDSEKLQRFLKENRNAIKEYRRRNCQ